MLIRAVVDVAVRGYITSFDYGCVFRVFEVLKSSFDEVDDQCHTMAEAERYPGFLDGVPEYEEEYC